MKIKIPNSYPDQFGNSLNFLINLIDNLGQTESKKISFYFSGTSFVLPFIIGGLVSIYHSLLDKKIEVDFIKGDNSYLDTISFPMGFNFNGLDSSTMISSLAKYQTKNYIPLVIYPTGKNVNDSSLRENVLSAINSILKLQLKLKGNV